MNDAQQPIQRLSTPTALALFGFVPGFGYTAIVVLGAIFGIRAPAAFLVDTLLATAWSVPVFYASVIGGSVLSVVMSLSLADGRSAGSRLVRTCGWSGLMLLLINVPLLLFQIQFALLDD